jgi:BirA family biotin operon repressor/biotin-[acetyl-CoA-carboxylase] ligase
MVTSSYSLYSTNGSDYLFFPNIDSTNTWAKQNAQNLSKQKITFVTADQQTAGRGRFNRKWISPAGMNLYTSICFFLKPDPNKKIFLNNISQILAVSVVEVLKELNFDAKLKWPNDIFLNHKKLGGILSETTQIDDCICFIAGLGLNVNMPYELLENVGQPATSLLIEGGNFIETPKLFKLVEIKFINSLNKLNDEGFASFFEKYIQFLLHSIGQNMQFNDHSNIWTGKFHSLNKDGSLNLQLSTGEIRKFLAGEITGFE